MRNYCHSELVWNLDREHCTAAYIVPLAAGEAECQPFSCLAVTKPVWT